VELLLEGGKEGGLVLGRVGWSGGREGGEGGREGGVSILLPTLFIHRVVSRRKEGGREGGKEDTYPSHDDETQHL
jgi:hypothetical protein